MLENFDINRWKIVLICTGYNLLFEYSMRGINDLARSPALPFALFLIYFTLFTMLEDIILRYRLRDYQLIFLSFFYGTIYLAFASSFLFAPPTLLGINYLYWIFVNFIWWGILQGVLTFYLANRLVQRDWNRLPMSKLGWSMAGIINGFTLFIIAIVNPFAYKKTPEGLISMGIILVIFGYLAFRNIIKSGEKEELMFEPSKLLDLIVIATIILFVFCAIFLISDPGITGGSHSNWLASIVVMLGTLIIGIILTLYRLISKKPISI